MSDNSKEPDYSALEVPINAAATVIAAQRGIAWNRTIRVTNDISLGELHVGPLICRINPRTITREKDLVKLLDRLFLLATTLTEVRASKRLEAISDDKNEIKRRLTHLRRALHNGEYERLLQELNDFVPPPLVVPENTPPAAPHTTSYEEAK